MRTEIEIRQSIAVLEEQLYILDRELKATLVNEPVIETATRYQRRLLGDETLSLIEINERLYKALQDCLNS